MGFYTGVSKKFEDADFYSIKRGDPYLQRGKEKCCVWYPTDEQKNPIFTGTGNSLECECVVFGTFPFFQRTNESKQARGMGIL